MPVCFLRAAWFMENSAWDVEPAREKGVISSFLQPLDKPVPMVATADIGRVAAELFQETWTGRRIIELEGPTRVTPNQIAATFAELFGHPVRAEAVPRQTWEPLFRSQGMKHPEPRHPNARRLQPRMDRIRAERNHATKRADRIERSSDGIGRRGMNRRPTAATV